MPEWLWLAAGYLCGSVPVGLLLTRMAGLGDIRTIGSGNIGATNVLRTGSKKLAALTLALDVVKGVLPTGAALYFAPVVAPWVGLLAVLGHSFPVWLKFKGGKGVSTSFGVLATLHPTLGGLLALTWIITFAFTRISSLSALVAAACAPFFAFLMIQDSTFWVVLALSALLILRHHGNIKRLVSGEEAPTSFK